MKLGIGIDTGGTYTDAVIYNFENKTILGSAKSLTTKNDLTVGILGAIDSLPPELVRQAEIISLSTTLATNACVEDKGGRAKLIFFGGDKKVIDSLGKQYGLPSSDEIYIQESYTSFSGEAEREPDWELFEKETDNGFDNLDGVGIIEMNAMRNGAAVEKKAKEIFRRRHDIPIVCGHELFSELNSLRRGASTLLNASLFPVIREFMESVKKALTARDIHPSAIVIVRSDGSLMSEEFASSHPVETLLCGPAASVIGCTKLTERQNAVVVDMGGTTTDIALVNGGTPVKVTDGVSIGKWKTFVNGMYVKTIGLGGDSAVHYDGTKLFIEEYRVVPLCIAAAKYPSVVDKLKNLQKKKHTRFLYEFYMLVKDIETSDRYTDEERSFCRALKNGPLLITEAAEAVGKDIYSLNVKRLIKDGVVQQCGLTPTDIMHIKGDFTEYCTEASLLGAEFAAFNLEISVDELCGAVYNEVKKKLYINIVKALLEHKYPDFMKKGVDSGVERFISDNYEEIRKGRQSELFSVMFKTEYALVGVGAPIFVFLRDVAEMLRTEAVIPKNHEVANAVGAIAGSVSASCTIEIKPNNNAEGTDGFIVYGRSGNRFFKNMEEAVEFAISDAKESVLSEARKRGAMGEISVTAEVHSTETTARGEALYLGTVVTANAAGTMGF